MKPEVESANFKLPVTFTVFSRLWAFLVTKWIKLKLKKDETLGLHTALLSKIFCH